MAAISVDSLLKTMAKPLIIPPPLPLPLPDQRGVLAAASAAECQASATLCQCSRVSDLLRSQRVPPSCARFLNLVTLSMLGNSLPISAVPSQRAGTTQCLVRSKDKVFFPGEAADPACLSGRGSLLANGDFRCRCVTRATMNSAVADAFRAIHRFILKSHGW
jgi:hypothetical protein